jgi:hypothetical protein
MDDSAVLIHYRNRLGFAIISFKDYKQPTLKNEPDYLRPASAQSYGSNGVLMVSSNNSTAAAGDTQYEVVSISDPASPKPLATIPAVMQRLDREQTGTIFLLTDSGLTVVRCLAAEREHQSRRSRRMKIECFLSASGSSHLGLLPRPGRK